MEELIARAVEAAKAPFTPDRKAELPSLRSVAEELGTTVIRTRKLLITAGYFTSPTAQSVQRLKAEGKTIEEIGAALRLKPAAVYGYLPYELRPYNLSETTSNADRHKRYWIISHVQTASPPVTTVSEQKDRFRKYLIQRKDVKFSFDGTAYSIRIVGCDVFPQGFAAVADKLAEFKGTTMLCDIGNGTMNIMTISNGKPNPQKCYTEKYGTYQCMLSVREQLMRKFGTAIDDDVIDDALRYGTADIGEKYLTVIREVAQQYVAGIMRRLREHEYNPELMKLYIVGGGGCLIRNFGEYDPNRVTINDDIRATAKGYEFLANLKLKKANAA